MLLSSDSVSLTITKTVLVNVAYDSLIEFLSLQSTCTPMSAKIAINLTQLILSNAFLESAQLTYFIVVF